MSCKLNFLVPVNVFVGMWFLQMPSSLCWALSLIFMHAALAYTKPCIVHMPVEMHSWGKITWPKIFLKFFFLPFKALVYTDFCLCLFGGLCVYHFGYSLISALSYNSTLVFEVWFVSLQQSYFLFFLTRNALISDVYSLIEHLLESVS
jgi:hypothetical protein